MIPGTTQSVASLTDITYQKRIQNALKESEEKFKLITEQSLLSIGILQDGVFKYFNQQFIKKTGYTRREIESWKPGEFLKIIHPNYRDFVKEQATIKQRGEKDVIVHYEFQAVRKNGEVYWEEIYSKPVKYKGRFADLITTIEITDRKEAEIKLKQSQKRYFKAYNRAEFYKDLFAHDFANLLQSIESIGELIEIYQKNQKGQENSKKVSELLDLLQSQVLRGANLISNVRKLSLLDNNDIDLKQMSVKKALQEAIKDIKEKFEKKRIEIGLSLPKGDLLIKANELLYDVYINLLLNAIKYNDNTEVLIDIDISKIQTDDGIFIKLELKDNGRGIRDERKEKIFQRDYTDGEKGQGIGLGLSLVKRILDTYNATITVEDRIKGNYHMGSNFIIVIPQYK